CHRLHRQRDDDQENSVVGSASAKLIMKAYYSTAYGNSEASVFGDLPDPVAGPGQLLVEIKAVSINPVDWKIRRGDAKVVTGFRFPRIFGADFAGIVRETG